jgi:hypothetical protein
MHLTKYKNYKRNGGSNYRYSIPIIKSADHVSVVVVVVSLPRHHHNSDVVRIDIGVQVWNLDTMEDEGELMNADEAWGAAGGMSQIMSGGRRRVDERRRGLGGGGRHVTNYERLP